MATQDISRFLHQPNKHYASAQMQQGRVITDADFNEASMIEAEDLRASLVDIVCTRGTPNDGMLVSSVVDDAYDFTLAAGSYYIGGLRFAVDAVPAPDPAQTLLRQSDWLQIDGLNGYLPAEPVDGRTDLVFVRAWEQPVTAIEDSELREVALGDRTTSVRIKRMRQFDVKTGLVADDCAGAFDELITELTATYADSAFDVENSELHSGARLQVFFIASDKKEDLCANPTSTGYVGAENQAIRVELRPGNKLVWGFDNASKIYRVIPDSENLDQLTFLTEPADLPSMPRAGQVVEILPWGALLPNMEKVAEQQGVITTVATTYDPQTKLLVISDALDASWTDWLAAHDEYDNDSDPEGEEKYLYLRVWNRGSELVDESHPAEIDLGEAPDPIPDVTLGTTGLNVTLTQRGIPGDYWIIAARPSTPDAVVPWDLASDAVPPHGPRRFYAPLAMIDWTVGVETTSIVTDCRTRLRRLCEGGCCSVTLGDGKHSFGMVNDLADAFDLISDGGTLCVLPGIHVGSVVLENHMNIIIEGCGPKSILQSPAPTAGDPIAGDEELFYDSVLTIRDCERIQVKNLRIQTHSAVGLMIETSTAVDVCEDILVEDISVFSTGSVNGVNSVYEFAAPCLAVRGASDVVIRRCHFEMDRVSSIAAAVVLSGARLRLLDSRVAAPVFDGLQLGAMGGVQIRSATHEVDIIGCQIVGGWGNGISLGQVESFARDTGSDVSAWQAHNYPVGGGADWLVGPNLGALQYSVGASVTSSNTENVWLPVGPVEKVRIHDNLISRMGLSGIASMEFFDSTYDWDAGSSGPLFIVAVDLDISRNVIEDNVQITSALPSSLAFQNDRCVGGVCLAGSINPLIRGNQILRNGTGSLYTPVCGIGLIAAQNATIEGNRIIDNGPPTPVGASAITVGLRGGIAIAEIVKPRGYTIPAEVEEQAHPKMPAPVTDLSNARGASALVVRGNEVSQPLGRALWVQRGFGAITVTGNTFESFGNPVPGDAIAGASLQWVNGGGYVRPASGACVQIVDYGLALDVDWTDFTPPKPDWTDRSDSVIYGGNVLVADNVASLDWDIMGGHACSILVSTLGSALYDSNTSSVVTRNPYGLAQQVGEPNAIETFLADAILKFGAMSMVLTNVYIGGRSTVQASGNRSTEAQFDALFSLVVGPALTPVGDDIGALEHASSLIANTGTHCWVAGVSETTTKDSAAYNIAIYYSEIIGDLELAYSVVAAELEPDGRIISIEHTG
ncbi:DUF6519 domain-containing protein [Enhygromyxa salina]|uniref:Uncharacterized protein n=1 Tax=Enhygromyxa salina TaxID=215803 RepID=A0A2S9YDJ3_9BACT|nr:DUF6519 domain-containing protein [Enhygromyxa salina]PRQ03165.1 hypothetical protein ENSA7_54360 [Enhygromyxa salina]